MAWVYLDDQFPDHPKIARAGGDAAWLFVCGLAYCRRYNTGGTIPVSQVPRLTDRKTPTKLAVTLVEVGLWERHDNEYRVHDYDEWNKPQESRSAAARKAAKARWSAQKPNAPGNADAYADASDPQSERIRSADASGCPPPQPPNCLTSASPTGRGGGHGPQPASQPAEQARIRAKRAVLGIATERVELRIAAGQHVDSPDGLAARIAEQDLWPALGAQLQTLAAEHPKATPAELARMARSDDHGPTEPPRPPLRAVTDVMADAQPGPTRERSSDGPAAARAAMRRPSTTATTEDQ